MKISQYCSVCKAEYEMHVVPTDDDDGVIWLQCPMCKGYLPKVRASLPPELLDSTAGPADESGQEAAAEETAVANIEPEPETAPVEEEPTADEADEPAPAAADTVIGEPAAEPAEGDADEEPAEDPDEGLELLETMDVSRAEPYRPWKTYDVGAVIHHLAWDDHGIVLAPEQLPGARRVVKVRFEGAGLVRLIEDDGSRPG